MARRVYSKRYARAIFEIAVEKGQLDRWLSDLRRLLDLSMNAELMGILEHPKVRFEDKKQLLGEQLKDMSQQVVNLASLLVLNGTLDLAGDIRNEYQRLVNEHKGIEQAEVVTAVALEAEDRQRLSERLSALIGKRIEIKSVVDPGIIGGIVARIDGKLLDGSTLSRLVALKKGLVGGGRS